MARFTVFFAVALVCIFQPAYSLLDFLNPFKDFDWDNSLTSAQCKVDEHSCDNYGQSYFNFIVDGEVSKFTANAEGAVKFSESKLWNTKNKLTLFFGGHIVLGELYTLFIRSGLKAKEGVTYAEFQEENPYSVSTNIIKTAGNTKCAGKQSADFINNLVLKGFPAENIHLIGLNHGAFRASYAAIESKNLGSTLGRVTALDPWKVCFIGAENSPLNPTIANKVDVYHTDTILGDDTNRGQADFHINCGHRIQPGTIGPVTSSGSAASYFASTVREGGTCLAIENTSCDNFKSGGTAGNIIVNGYHWDGTPGVYYFTANKFPPFCRGPSGTTN